MLHQDISYVISSGNLLIDRKYNKIEGTIYKAIDNRCDMAHIWIDNLSIEYIEEISINDKFVITTTINGSDYDIFTGHIYQVQKICEDKLEIRARSMINFLEFENIAIKSSNTASILNSIKQLKPIVINIQNSKNYPVFNDLDNPYRIVEKLARNNSCEWYFRNELYEVFNTGGRTNVFIDDAKIIHKKNDKECKIFLNYLLHEIEAFDNVVVNKQSIRVTRIYHDIKEGSITTHIEGLL